LREQEEIKADASVFLCHFMCHLKIMMWVKVWGRRGMVSPHLNVDMPIQRRDVSTKITGVSTQAQSNAKSGENVLVDKVTKDPSDISKEYALAQDQYVLVRIPKKW
jgi:hypothetical protein